MTSIEKEGNLKQPQSTKEKIEEHAITFFSEKGYAATSMREIAEAASVTKPVVYYYFGSKESLCDHLISSGLGRFSAVLRDICENGADDVFEGLVTLVQLHFDFCEANVDFVRFIYALTFGPDRKKISYDFHAYDEEIFKLRMKLLRRASETGLIRKGKEEDAVRYLQGIISTYVMYRVDGNGQFPDGLARTIVTDMVNGLRA